MRPTNLYEEFLEGISIPAVVTTFDAAEPEILAANPAHQKLTGYAQDELCGKSPRVFKGEKTDRQKSAELKLELSEHNFYVGEIVNYRKDGTTFRMELTILGAIINGHKRYVALKKYLAEV